MDDGISAGAAHAFNGPVVVNALILRYLAYLGPNCPNAELSFSAGLNVICGASDTGKSYVAETIDFMLGQESPVRDIPERAGYDRIRLKIETSGYLPLNLERSIEGGNYTLYDEQPDGTRNKRPVLRWKHSPTRQDTL